MGDKEATARIKINKLLEAAGWRFFPDGQHPANVFLEPSVKLKTTDLDAFGQDFEKVGKGFIDFLLCDTKGFPLIILEAKAEHKNPLPPSCPPTSRPSSIRRTGTTGATRRLSSPLSSPFSPRTSYWKRNSLSL